MMATMEVDSSSNTTNESGFITCTTESTVNRNDSSYNIRGRKLAMFFEKSRELKTVLESFGFYVKEYDNSTELNKKVMNELSNLSQERADISCIFVYISRTANEIINILKDSQQLVKVPKIVLFHTALQKKKDDEMQFDYSGPLKPVKKLPTHADMLVIKLNTFDEYAVDPNEKMNVFITILREMLEKYHKEWDLKSILVLTNNTFISSRESMEDKNSGRDHIYFLDTQRKLIYFEKVNNKLNS